jgi:hypothetical protein
MKVNFKLPNTKMCLVLVFNNNRPPYKELIPTPATNEGLRTAMLAKKVGYSQIRAVEPVKEMDLQSAMQPNFRRA